MKPIFWYDLLTLDHTVCRICYASGSSVRMVTDPDTTKLRGRPRKAWMWVSAAKAAFRAHVRDVHPDWADRVQWVR